MTQLFVVSSLFQAAVLAAAVTEDAIAPTDGERVLVTACRAPVPEGATPLLRTPGFTAVARRFDRVVDLGEVLAPLRPVDLSPREAELPVWERLLRDRWDVGPSAVELFVEPPHAGTGLALARIFATATVSVHADRLLAHGPTRRAVPADVAARLGTLVHPDLVPGLGTLLLREHGTAAVTVGVGALTRVLTEMSDAVPRREARPRPFALVLGPADVPGDGSGGYGSPQDELRRSLVAVRSRGTTRVLLQPGGARVPLSELLAVGRDLGLSIAVANRDELPEALALRERPDQIVGCSPALVTTHAVARSEAIAVGVDRILDALTPFQTSARIPATILDALHSPDAPAAPLPQLVKSVAFCMQPIRAAELRPVAESFFAAQPQESWRRYVRVLRAERVGLVRPRSASAPPLRGLALVESPLQLISAYEAFCRGVLGTRCDVLLRPGPGMERTAAALGADLPVGLRLVPAGTTAPGPPDGAPLTVLALGDTLSGKLQARLVAGRLPRSVLLLDDGTATAAALTALVDRRQALVRAHVPALPHRRLLAGRARRALVRLAEEGRLTVLTALALPPGLVERLTLLGARVHRHSFEHLSGLAGGAVPALRPRPTERLVVLGSALPSDGLVDPAAYAAWVAAQAATEPVRYLPHRRETSAMLERLRRVPGLTMEDPGLPAELMLRDLGAPGVGDRDGVAPVRVRSLPSTALLTLRPMLTPRGVTIEPVAVPAGWWTVDAPPALRAHLSATLVPPPGAEGARMPRLVDNPEPR